MKKLFGYPTNEHLYQKIRKQYVFKIQTQEELKQRKEVILYLFSKDMTYQEIGDRLQITRERVRQILSKEGFSGKQRQKMIREKRIQEKLLTKEKRLHTLGKSCLCGRVFIPDKRRALDSELCPTCYKKNRAKLSGYAAQRKWGRIHYKEVYAKEKARGFPAQKRYHLKHRKKLIKKLRKYYHKQSRKKFAIRTMRFIQIGLQIIGSTCK